MNDQPHTAIDFDGCNRKCRRAGAHTLVWGECEHATEPEPTVSLSRVYKATDGLPAIGFDTYTVPQLAELIEPALRTIKIHLGPNARVLLERGETVGLSVGEYASLALAAADAVVHRNDPNAAPVAVPVSAVPDTLRDRIAEALWPLTDWDGDRLNAERAADSVLAVLPPPADRAAVLREAADDLTDAFGDPMAKHIGALGASHLRRRAREIEAGREALRRLAAEVPQPEPAAGVRQPDTETPTPAEDPARIDRLRPEFTDHASVESIDAQLQRARSQERRWHLRVEWLISLRQVRVAQKERGEWPAAGAGQDGAQT
ncbi:hypothetical protein [Streptomyces cupreus]|uniref:Uncharacterized protein n=1 Tax=Streptomyces cupreus TaxID=2759956 RepID=A0A7X1J2U9_9ACTN|nr:hypothetical protein [Streptomyces cupreus]MBC2903180.1 hypothetical protein [Streptomyces cupreus]